MCATPPFFAPRTNITAEFSFSAAPAAPAPHTQTAVGTHGKLSAPAGTDTASDGPLDEAQRPLAVFASPSSLSDSGDSGRE
ncbi:MAG: hypothetical protein INR71_06640, partial [Terriglobus roseus]|nr:hypothetical protein [Terriglobus roseus]